MRSSLAHVLVGEAGARPAAMSLGSVPDAETAALMADFYGRLSAGEGKARALQAAALAQLQICLRRRAVVFHLAKVMLFTGVTQQHPRAPSA